MELTEEIFDSPVNSVASHIQRYVRTGGKKGQLWYGRNTLLLTTRGRKTGFLRRTVAIYGEDEDRYVLVAANNGLPTHPCWYLNLVDDPEVWVQVGADTFPGTARPATPDERPELWKFMLTVLPHYAAYQAKIEREMPVVILERNP